jgi:TRAP-type C4-dicarboxylate transport system substrate-binding protein
MIRFTRRYALTAAAALLTATAAHAQVQDRSFKFATQNPKGHPIVMGWRSSPRS